MSRSTGRHERGDGPRTVRDKVARSAGGGVARPAGGGVVRTARGEAAGNSTDRPAPAPEPGPPAWTNADARGDAGAGNDGDAQSRGAVTVTVRGELDLTTADSLYRRGRAAIGDHARLLLLDLAALSFCDSRGLAAFVRIANDADAAGCRYGLIAPQPLVAKVLRITRLDERLPVFATIEEARRRLFAKTAPASG